jgi:hypothetical protein
MCSFAASDASCLLIGRRVTSFVLLTQLCKVYCGLERNASRNVAENPSNMDTTHDTKDEGVDIETDFSAKDWKDVNTSEVTQYRIMAAFDVHVTSDEI